MPSSGNQALQNASQSVQAGGQGGSAALGNLGQILAQLNQQIAQAFMRQQQESNQQVVTASQAGAKAVEDMANKISTEFQRQKERRENLTDTKTLYDYQAKLGREATENERQYRRDLEQSAASEKQAKMKETEALAKRIEKLKMDEAKYQNGLNENMRMLMDPNNKLSPERREQLIQANIDARLHLDSMHQELPELEWARQAAEVDVEQRFAAERAGMDPNPMSALGPKPKKAPMASPTSAATSSPSMEAPAGPRPLIPREGVHPVSPDPVAMTVAIQMDMAKDAGDKAYNTEAQVKKLKEGLLKFQERSDQLAQTEETFRKVLDQGADGAIRRAFLQAQGLSDENTTTVLDSKGRVTAIVPKADALMDLMMTNMLEPFGKDKVDMWRKYKNGDLKIDTEEMVPFGLLVTQAQQQIYARLKTIKSNLDAANSGNEVKSVGGMDTRAPYGWYAPFVPGGTSISKEARQAANDLTDQITQQALAGEDYFFSQPAVRGVYKMFNTSSGLKRMLGITDAPVKEGQPAKIFDKSIDRDVLDKNAAQLAGRVETGPIPERDPYMRGELSGPPASNSFVDTLLRGYGMDMSPEKIEEGTNKLMAGLRSPKPTFFGKPSSSGQSMIDLYDKKQKEMATVKPEAYVGYAYPMYPVEPPKNPAPAPQPAQAPAGPPMGAGNRVRSQITGPAIPPQTLQNQALMGQAPTNPWGPNQNKTEQYPNMSGGY